MLCPYCHTEYTTEHPCFCQPPLATKKAEPDYAPRILGCAEDQAMRWSARGGMRLD